MQIYNKGEATIHASKSIRPKHYVELDDKEAEMLLKMYAALECPPKAIDASRLEAENAELKKKIEELSKAKEEKPAIEEVEEVEEIPAVKKRPYKKRK